MLVGGVYGRPGVHSSGHTDPVGGPTGVRNGRRRTRLRRLFPLRKLYSDKHVKNKSKRKYKTGDEDFRKAQNDRRK